MEKIKNIILWDNNNVEYGHGSIPLQWSWEPESYCTPKAFLLYVRDGDFVEMRQIYIAQRCRERGIGSALLKDFERIHEGKLIHIYVRFTDHDPDNIFHDFLVSQGYKPDINKPELLWTKQL